MTEFSTEASVHMPIGEGYRVKVSVLGIGMYINGAMVYPPSEKNNNKWMVFLPSINNRFGKRMYPIEFNKQSSLWLEIYEEAIKSVKEYRTDTGESFTEDVVIDDIDGEEDIDAGLDEAIKRYGL